MWEQFSLNPFSILIDYIFYIEMGSVDNMPIVIKNESAFQAISGDPQAVKKKQ